MQGNLIFITVPGPSLHILILKKKDKVVFKVSHLVSSLSNFREKGFYRQFDNLSGQVS